MAHKNCVYAEQNMMNTNPKYSRFRCDPSLIAKTMPTIPASTAAAAMPPVTQNTAPFNVRMGARLVDSKVPNAHALCLNVAAATRPYTPQSMIDANLPFLKMSPYLCLTFIFESSPRVWSKPFQSLQLIAEIPNRPYAYGANAVSLSLNQALANHPYAHRTNIMISPPRKKNCESSLRVWNKLNS